MARRLKRNANYYVIEGGDLYKRGFTAPLLKCLTRDQSEYVINEMHRGMWNALKISINENPSSQSRVLLVDNEKRM